MASTRKTMMQLISQYGDKDIKKVLKSGEYLKSGYYTAKDTDFLRWVCYAALKRIEELEGKE